MGLFDKKYCDVCGEKIGLLGNRKLEDGNLCKTCAAKLSPWFSDRRRSTVEEIKAQLDYREANRGAVAAFHTTRTLGRNTKVLLDEDAGMFMVTSARDLSQANPDVISYAQVTGCDLDIQEDKNELKREVRDSEGRTEHVSYNPPRYEYEYDFYMIIRVNHPYFDEIRFRLNSSSVEIHNPGAANRPMMRPIPGADILGSVLQGLNNALNQAANPAAMTDPRMQNPDYAEYYNMGQEIKAALTQIRTQVREEINAANAPKTAVVCPACGATTMPDASGCCEYCGSPVR